MYSVGDVIAHKFWGKGQISHVFFNRAFGENRKIEGVTFQLLDKKKKKDFNKSRERIPGVVGDIVHRCYEDNLSLVNYMGL
jgi:hypothetical protein